MIHSIFLAIFKKNSFQGPIRPLVQFLQKPGTRVKYFLILYFSAKFQVCWFIHSKVLAPSPGPWVKFWKTSSLIHSKVLAIFRKNSFQDPIRTLVQILKNSGTRVKYFCMLYLSAEFQVHRFIPSKVLFILRKTIFKAPSGPWSKFWKTPGHVSNIF